MELILVCNLLITDNIKMLHNLDISISVSMVILYNTTYQVEVKVILEPRSTYNTIVSMDYKVRILITRKLLEI